MKQRRRWDAWECEFMRLHYPHQLGAHLATALGRDVKTVYAKASDMGLAKSPEFMASDASGRLNKLRRAGEQFQFRADQVPWNKGTHFDAGGRSIQTQFRPGNKPHTWVPVGTYRVVTHQRTGDKHVQRKISDAPGPYTVRWRPVAHLVWEAAHGPVPAGMSIVFKPGRKTLDPDAITADALECLTRAELMARNTVHNYPPEIVALVQLRSALNRKINAKAREAEPA